MLPKKSLKRAFCITNYIVKELQQNLSLHRGSISMMQFRELRSYLYTAILGGQTLINTMRNPIKINVNKETENGKVLRLKGMGMPRFGKENEYGDLFAKVIVILPKNLSIEEIELFKKLSNIKSNINAETI